MNKAKRNFWLDIVLLVLFIVIVASLPGHHTAGWATVHAIAGTLMILGSLVHVAWHWPWLKANFLRYPRNPGRVVRANRRIDIPLLVLFIPCGVSGLLVWLMDLTSATYIILLREGWSHLHHLTGLLILLLMLLHSGRHLKWLVCMARKCFAPGKQMKLTLDR